MNHDQIEGYAKQVVGKIQEIAGHVMGNVDQEYKGVDKQVEGDIQISLGEGKQIEEASRKKAETL